ncbi:hypothetical protein [Canibacter zhoujuaniae]|uniref:hypothetical protein n=1 Tax=Canibacter zhoujuaniae TaxID=2708343 RepID=UPI00141FFA1C|nr:hypothetical protein [Canibacter zhoujuaniae]
MTTTTKRTRTGSGTFTVGESDSLTAFDGQVTSVTLEPDVSQDDDIEVLSGNFIEGERKESWTLSGSLLNDFGQSESLVEFCFENRGKKLPFKFTPNRSAAKVISGQLVVEAVAIGGDVGETPSTDFEFKLVGVPLLENKDS